MIEWNEEMEKREQKFTTRFKKWLDAKWWGSDVLYWEAKVAVGDSLPFSAVSPKQNDNLDRAENAGFNFKFSDFDRMGTPFDGIWCAPRVGVSYVVVYFEGDKVFYMIPAERWLEWPKEVKRKSVTREMLSTCTLCKTCELGR